MAEKGIKSNEEQNRYWSEFADRYHKTLYKQVKEYPSLLMRHRYILELINSDASVVADIGCGPGEMVLDLRAKGCRTFGVDIALGMLRVAAENIREKNPEGGLDLQCASIEALPFRENSIDGAVCSGVIEYLKSDNLALKELNRILRPNGTLIITARNKACPARVFDFVLDQVKEAEWGAKLVNGVRQKLGKGCMNYISYRKHFPWELDRTLYEHGFRKVDFRYFHFYPFFIPMDKIFPSFFIRTGLRMERLSGKTLGILGSGYIVKSIKFRDL